MVISGQYTSDIIYLILLVEGNDDQIRNEHYHLFRYPVIYPADNERWNCLDCMCYYCTGNYSNRSDGYTRLKLGGVIFYLLQVSHESATGFKSNN